jgi:predicted kinase
MTNIIFITGVPASGKSTVARKLAEHFPKSLHIQVDQLREMMVNGVELPDHSWNDEATRQFQRARSTAIYMAQLYAQEGVDVVIDDVCVPDDFPRYYESLFSDPTVYRVLLMPTEDALRARMEKRAGPFDHFLVDLLPWFFSYLQPMSKEGWIVIDTSDWTVEKTVQEVLTRIGAFEDESDSRLQANDENATQTNGWQLFDDSRFDLQFRYPRETSEGNRIEKKERQENEVIRVHLVSRDSQQLYLEVTKYQGLDPKQEYERHKEDLEKRFQELSITDIQAIDWKSLPGYQYSFEWPQGRRSVMVFDRNGSTYRILYDPRSPLNLQVLSTVEWTGGRDNSSNVI